MIWNYVLLTTESMSTAWYLTCKFWVGTWDIWVETPGAQLSTSPSHSSVYGSVGSVPGSVQANSLTMNSWFLLLITLVQWVTCSRSMCFVRAVPGIGRQEVHTCSRWQRNTREEVWLSLSPPAHSSLDLTDIPLVSRLWGLARCCCLCDGSGKGWCTE